MTTAAWIRVAPWKSMPTTREQIRGVDVSVEISPYDLPEAFRGYRVHDRGVLRIEFKYLDDEPADLKRLDDYVSVELGAFSRKVLAIEIAVDRHKVDVVRLTFPQALDRADETLKVLQKDDALPSARLNYSAVDQVLQKNRDNPEFVVA